MGTEQKVAVIDQRVQTQRPLTTRLSLLPPSDDIRFWTESGETKWEASIREGDLLIEQRVWGPWA